MCLCFAAHSQPWARSPQPGTPGCAFAHPPTPVRALTQPCTPVRTPVPALAQPCTLLHAFRAATASHTSAHSHTPGRALARPCTPSHVPCTPVHPLPQRGTPVHTLAHLCTFLYTSACSSTALHTLFTPLMLSQPCTPVHFTPCAHSHPPRAHSHPAVPSGPAPVLLHTPCTSLPPRVLARPSCPCPALGALARSTRSCTLTPSTPWWPQLLGVPCGFTPLPGCPLCVPHSWSGLTPVSCRVRPGMLRGAEH